MSADHEPGAVLRFGVFEVDLAARELRKSGASIKLQDQPFLVLALLLERPGEIVTREQLREAIWSDDTFVEFDASLNTAIQKIRQALGDSAGSARFVETIPRQGYRFVAPVERQGREPDSGRSSVKTTVEGVAAAGSLPQPTSIDPRTIVEPQTRRFQAALVTTAVLLVAGGVGLFAIWFGRPERQTQKSPSASASVTRLVISLPEGHELVTGTTQVCQLEFSPDGRTLAYLARDPGGTSRLYLRSLDAFESVPLPGTEGASMPFFSADGKWLGFAARGAVWKTSVRGGAPQKVFDLKR